MQYCVLTLFPEMFSAFQAGGIIKRCVENDQVSIDTVDIRDFATDRHRTVDDSPYGGGCGMVMKPEPLAAAIGHARESQPDGRVVLLTPQGRLLDHHVAEDLASRSGLILVCGRYEGVDERIREEWIEDEISIGDYVLTGGELAAMVIMDAVTRFIPGCLGNADSARDDSFSAGLLEYPQYTRPRLFRGSSVPGVLLSGDHGAIKDWRRRASMIRTLVKRPDLMKTAPLTTEDLALLADLRREIEAVLTQRAERS
jgi:tRNA (guanine37-N1)-methyltransferase